MSYWENSGKSDEWYTPAEVFDALGCTFDMDVAPAREGADHVPTAFRMAGDGLAERWHGFVWMNPPFGGRNGLTPWLDKFVAHGNGIALTPDRPSAPWFQTVMPLADAVLFTRKLKFVRPDGTPGKSPSNGTALFGMGGRAVAALKRAELQGFGILAFPK